MPDEKLTYTTLETQADAQFEEKRSVFIGHAGPAKTEEEANEFIRRMKKQYADATHNVSDCDPQGLVYPRRQRKGIILPGWKSLPA